MANPPGKCIFCGKGKLSKEHVYADWMRHFIPRTLPTTETFSAIVHKTHQETRTFSQSGDPHSRRLRVVCKVCNIGWMSELQQLAKPLLIPLIEGSPTVLTPEAQQIIGAWASMGVMVAEYHEKDKIAIAGDDRSYLMEHRKTPPNWKIWIGHYQRGEWRGHWLHNVLPVSLEKDVPSVPMDTIPRPNTQTTSFVAGQLYIHAMSSSIPQVTDLFRFVGSSSSKIAQIWPIQGEAIDWPLDTLTDLEAHRIANTFFNWALRRSGYDPI